MSFYLNALGIINSLGDNQKDVLGRILNGSPNGLVASRGYIENETVFVGVVSYPLPEVPKSLSKLNCRNNQLLLSAYNQIKDDIQEAIDEYGLDRVAVIIGSSTSGIAEGEVAIKEKLDTGKWPVEFDYKQQEVGTPSLFLKSYLKLTGLHYTISTACSSSARVFKSARNLLQMGVCDAVIVGGADSLCKLTVRGFNSLEAISLNKTNPMSLNRDGINIGEGAALFLMTKESSENAWEFLGYGDSSDAHHISAPEPEGLGAEIAIKNSLLDAKLSSDDMTYVNLHGTGTELNDIMEAKSFRRIFNDKMPCSSIKPMIGHTLGASGAIELAVCCMLISNLNQHNKLPPHLWDNERDEKIPELNLVKNNFRYQNNEKHYIMSNSFAFGGNNCSIIIGK
ncbi:MAG: beta-ketoacyl-[acyl-carrier-protein] synthase II [Planctomycetota bacterium]|nr:MAG: beta-ketoacyl-[acyl-carrier-protein] synthase II [Planctomycetota bacterium]